MKKRISQLMISFMFAFVALLTVQTVSDISLFSNDVVRADIFEQQRLDTGAAQKGEAGKILDSIYNAANIFSGFVLALSIIMIIVGGLRYILANGDQRQAEQGKMVLIYSGIGIVIALSAFTIARLFSSFSFVA